MMTPHLVISHYCETVGQLLTWQQLHKEVRESNNTRIVVENTNHNRCKKRIEKQKNVNNVAMSHFHVQLLYYFFSLR